jgi:hypothetical protein
MALSIGFSPFAACGNDNVAISVSRLAGKSGEANMK